MKLGVAIICRHDSSRVPGKVLRGIAGRSVLGHILDRVRRGAPHCPVVVATSELESDDPIARYCERAGVDCFRGSLADVAGRFETCAKGRGWDFVVRINGDNIFCDPATLGAMVAIAETDAYDLVTNVPGRTFPRGMSVEIVRTAFYAEVMASVDDAHQREHVTSWLYDNPDVGRRYVYRNQVCPEAGNMQLAIDTEDDIARTERMLALSRGAPSALSLSRLHALASEASPARSPWAGSVGPLLIAEIGGNHEGDFEVAKAMCASAIASGADAVKFQLYTGDTLVSSVESPDRHSHFHKFELEKEEHIALAEMCRDAGVQYMASVWDLDMLEWIDPYLEIYKIGSGDLTAWPIIEAHARRGKPMLLSTGLATLDEVVQTVRFIQSVDARYEQPEMLCVLQCTSMYPIPDSDANLRVMDALRDATGLAVGYSDHTVGSAALVAATAMGAEALEFHFTDSRKGKTFRDHKVSLTASEVQDLRKQILRTTAFRGDGVKLPQRSELDAEHHVSFRRAVYARRAIPKGERIAREDLVVLRPALGTDARDFDSVCGAESLRNLEPYVRLVPGEDYDWGR